MKKFIYVLLMFVSVSVKAQNTEHETDNKFDIKHFIFSHISNDYDFHVTTIGEHHISIPLPVIVKSHDRGWFVFLSSKFHHKTESYKGFSIAKDGQYSGQIVEILPNGTEYRPWDLSITKNVFSILFTTILLCAIFISIGNRYKKHPFKKPAGLQAILEPVILFVTEDIAKPAIGTGYEKYSGYLLTVFFLILALNLSGLIPVFPFGANVSGNINVTIALASCTFVVTLASTTKGYWMHKLWTPGVPSWLKVPVPLMPLVELLSVLTGPIALTIRLFANMLSGHMVVTVLMGMIFLFSFLGPIVDSGITAISVLFAIFMILLDVLVSFIQAYVFTLLSALYFGQAKHVS